MMTTLDHMKRKEIKIALFQIDGILEMSDA